MSRQILRVFLFSLAIFFSFASSADAATYTANAVVKNGRGQTVKQIFVYHVHRDTKKPASKVWKDVQAGATTDALSVSYDWSFLAYPFLSNPDYWPSSASWWFVAWTEADDSVWMTDPANLQGLLFELQKIAPEVVKPITAGVPFADQAMELIKKYVFASTSNSGLKKHNITSSDAGKTVTIELGKDEVKFSSASNNSTTVPKKMTEEEYKKIIESLTKK